MTRRKHGAVAALLALLAALASCRVVAATRSSPAIDLAELACSLPQTVLKATRRGHVPRRSGDIALIPRTPAYITDRSGGWPHSGPWPYLQRVPLVFYGPGLIPARGAVAEEATLADVAPTLADLMGTGLPTAEGKSLKAATPRQARAPRVIITIVWDGGGRNALEQWPDAWPTLASLERAGVSYVNAVVGSSPSVTPAVHTTLGTGTYPRTHGVPLIRSRGQGGRVEEAFQGGQSAASIRVPTLAEIWDQANRGRALAAMIGYQPWHLGMIGKGAERPGGDKDDAAWMNDAGQWVTNHEHYSLPATLLGRYPLGLFLRQLDSEDGRLDGFWGDDQLDDPAHLADTPAFARYHARELIELIEQGGYGDDGITDLIFTNFKQIDRNGHRFNMASEEVRRSLQGVDEALGELIAFLQDRFRPGEYAIVVTADHGLQPDADDVRGSSIDAEEVARDIDARFGDVTESVLPTEVFLDHDRLQQLGVDAEQIARYLADYRLEDNLEGKNARNAPDPVLRPQDRVFALAIPGEMLDSLTCGGAPAVEQTSGSGPPRAKETSSTD
jgi:arylsulfatase A-like enzyme